MPERRERTGSRRLRRMRDRGHTRAYLALTLVVTLWGSYPAFAKIALVHFPPFVLVALRTSLASAFLAALLLRRGQDRFRALGWSDLGQFAFLGFSGLFVSTGGTYLGIAFTTASSAVILQAATPVMVALGSRLYLGERLRAVQWAGVCCSTIGVLLVITKGSWRAVAHLGRHASECKCRLLRTAPRPRVGRAAKPNSGQRFHSGEQLVRIR